MKKRGEILHFETEMDLNIVTVFVPQSEDGLTIPIEFRDIHPYQRTAGKIRSPGIGGMVREAEDLYPRCYGLLDIFALGSVRCMSAAVSVGMIVRDKRK